jgi:hypothetical protein
MNLKILINQAVYGTIGYISSHDDINILEQYIVYNLPVLLGFQHIVVATNFSDMNLVGVYEDVWKRYFPECTLLTSPTNRGHNFGTTDLDNMIFNFCKENGVTYLCKASNDVLLQTTLFDKEVDIVDFYYLNGISYNDLYLSKFNYEELYNNRFYPQTNFYIINVSKCDYLNDKAYLDETYQQSLTIPNYNGKIWEYIEGWSCEDLLKKCIERNKLSKFHLIPLEKYRILLQVVKDNVIHDCSHKNIMIEGICHFPNHDHPIIEI